MRVMVLVKATKDSEAGIMPSTELLEAMGKFNEELVNAGIMLAGEGLKPSSQGKRVAFDGPSRTVIDGPFAETRELVAGFWLWEVKDMAEAVEWVKRCPNPMPGPSEIEIRPVFEMADFGDALTPEVAELHDRTREKAGRPLRPRRVAAAACLAPAPPLSGTRGGDRNPSGDRDGLPDRAGQAHRGPGPHGARRRPGRRAGAGRPRDRPRRMAEDRGSEKSRRLADGRGQAPGHRRVPPRQDARAQARRDRPRPRGRTRHQRRGHRGGHGRRSRRRAAGPDLHRLPSGAVARGARGADPAPDRRADDRRDRPRLPLERSDHRPAHRPGQEDARQGRPDLRGAARQRNERSASPRCWRSST